MRKGHKRTHSSYISPNLQSIQTHPTVSEEHHILKLLKASEDKAIAKTINYDKFQIPKEHSSEFKKNSIKMILEEKNLLPPCDKEESSILAKQFFGESDGINGVGCNKNQGKLNIFREGKCEVRRDLIERMERNEEEKEALEGKWGNTERKKGS